MPELKRGATLTIEQGIDLPMSPPITIYGKGKGGKVVCQLHINATGVVIAGPKGKVLRNLNWEDLIALAQPA